MNSDIKFKSNYTFNHFNNSLAIKIFELLVQNNK